MQSMPRCVDFIKKKSHNFSTMKLKGSEKRTAGKMEDDGISAYLVVTTELQRSFAGASYDKFFQRAQAKSSQHAREIN